MMPENPDFRYLLIIPIGWLSWWNNWKSKMTEEVLVLVLKVFFNGLLSDK